LPRCALCQWTCEAGRCGREWQGRTAPRGRVSPGMPRRSETSAPVGREERGADARARRLRRETEPPRARERSSHFSLFSSFPWLRQVWERRSTWNAPNKLNSASHVTLWNLRTEFLRGRSLRTFRPLISKITVFRRQGLQPFGICCLRSGVFSSFLTEFGSGNGSRRTQAARAMNEHAAAEHYRPVPASPLHTPVWHDR
jgi:hypothetical protein